MISVARFLGSNARPILVTLIAIAGLFSADRFLERAETSELRREANNEYAAGTKALRAGKADAAALHFGRAHSLVRQNRDYQLALADALSRVGRFDMAERNIREVLDQDSNDGEANLAMARLAARTSRPGDANAFYHRAVYGSWRADAAAKRTSARLELAEFLAAQKQDQELLSELLILQSEAESDPAIADRVAALLLVAGSPARAIAAYHDILRSRPDDDRALKGLAEAELRAGDFRRAQTSWLAALRRKADDPELAKRLQFVNSLAQMDPTPRRISSVEKYRRSEALLSAVRERIEACSGPGPLPATLSTAMADATQLLATRAPGPVTNERTESLLTAAEKLWAVRPAGCGPGPEDDPVPILMAKIAGE